MPSSQRGGDRYRLSDLGQGEDEAYIRDITILYHHQAKDVAELSGIVFDGRAFVITRVSAGQLVGATMAVADAASRAIDRAMQRADQRQRRTDADRLVARLEQIFPLGTVDRDAEVRGASTHPWKVDAAVRTQGSLAVFDFVTPNQTSVAFATTKFHDLARRDDAPVRIAVVHKKASMGAFLTVVSQAARVIEDEAADRTWLRAAAAA